VHVVNYVKTSFGAKEKKSTKNTSSSSTNTIFGSLFIVFSTNVSTVRLQDNERNYYLDYSSIFVNSKK
jgi:hypothetical protein